jgi:lipoic acid synthetase
MGDTLYQISGRHRVEPLPDRKPPWLKVQAPGGSNYLRLKNLMRELDLHTVCEEAHCPNVGECWQHGTATFMILGDVCTRNCAYCAVAHGRPPKFDPAEPERVGEAAAKMSLQHVVLTSVDRDDLPDFGAWAFAETIRQIHARVPGCSVEVLVPDFQGRESSIRTVLEAEPEIYNHNTETVPRLYKKCRPGGRYARVMEIFRTSKRIAPNIPTTTGIILGMGETIEEVLATMRDLREVDVDILTLGQYLRPSADHIPIDRYVTPDEFALLKREGMAMGFKHVESGPLVRSSYHARDQVPGAELKALRRRQATIDEQGRVIPLAG